MNAVLREMTGGRLMEETLPGSKLEPEQTYVHSWINGHYFLYVLK